MKKGKFLTMLSIMLSFIMTAAACVTTPPGGGDDDFKEGTTPLIIANYGGGFGEDWLIEAGNLFEEKYKDVSFRDGEKGVSVQVQTSKGYNAASILDTMSSYDHDVFFTTEVDYFNHLGRENFLDITDIVTEPLTEFGEQATIESKLSKFFQDYYKAKDGRYYALPFTYGFYGLIYDADLFDDRGWYFNDDGEFVSDLSEKSKGLDGKEGTYDDGLPTTYAQFERLLEEIRGTEVVPISWALKSYMMRWAMTYWMDYEGYDRGMLNYTIDSEMHGKAEVVTNIIGDGYTAEIQTQEIDINYDNGVEIQKQPGKYYGLTMLRDVVLGNTDNYIVQSTTFREQQKNYIKGNLSSEFTTYAMHVDGDWFENEAATDFNSLSQLFDNTTRKDRRFAFMPIPKVSDSQVGEKQTLFSQGSSGVFINSSTDVPELAKLFVQYMHTNDRLSAFTRDTSMVRPLNYTMTDADVNAMSYYGKCMKEMVENSDVVHSFSSSQIFMDNSAYFDYQTWGWRSLVSNTQHDNPCVAFMDNPNLTAKQYFNGLYYYNLTRWSSVIKNK